MLEVRSRPLSQKQKKINPADVQQDRENITGSM
jgi:hypothetical protein